MSLIQLWWAGLTQPAAALEEIGQFKSLQWAFGWVVGFNVLISLTTTAAQILLGRAPQLPSALTFLPTERYLQAELFFLPVLRVCLWLLQAAIIHLTLRLARQSSNMDQILLIGGFTYLLVMPPLMVTDWVLVASDQFEVHITMFTHGFAALWSMDLTILGLRVLLQVPRTLAIVSASLALVLTLPFLMVFAR